MSGGGAIYSSGERQNTGDSAPMVIIHPVRLMALPGSASPSPPAMAVHAPAAAERAGMTWTWCSGSTPCASTGDARWPIGGWAGRLSVAVEMEFQCRIGGALLGEILQLLGHPGIFGCCSREPGKFVEELRHLGRRQDQAAVRVDPLQHGMAAASSNPVDEADESVVGIGRDGDGGELPALRAAATSLHSHQRHIHTHDHIIVRTPGEISGPFGVRLVEPFREMARTADLTWENETETIPRMFTAIDVWPLSAACGRMAYQPMRPVKPQVRRYAYDEAE